MRTIRLFRFLFVLGLVFFFALPLFSQDSSNWYYGKKIRSIEFEGLKNVTNMELSGVTSPFEGKEFTDEVYFDLLNHILALEFFDDISSDALPGDSSGNSVVIKFTVVERPFVSKISFSGNKHISSSELKTEIAIKEKDIFNSNKVLLDERTIRDAYLKKGYTNVRVTSTTQESGDGVEIIFQISEGRSTVLKSVSFTGNQVVASKTLKGLLTMKEAGLFTKGSFQESQLELDKQYILSYYHTRGYIDATILDVVRTTTYNEKDDCDELEIQFVIQEGVQYTFGGITFDGNKIFTTETLRALMPLKDGEVFNQEKYQTGLYVITNLYYENGYTSNIFTPQESKNLETKQVTVNFIIIEKPRSHIEDIIVKGNTKTKDYVILRELPIESGDIYSNTKVTSGLRNLYNLQFFSAIVPDVVAGSEENLVDLIISVEEQSTTSIEFGVTFSGVANPDALPLSLFFKWQDSNAFGTGKSISANTVLSTDSQSLSLGYADSWLFGQPISVSVSAGIEHSLNNTLRLMYLPDGTVDDTNYLMDYRKVGINMSTSVGRRWVPDFAIFSLTGGIAAEISRNFYDDGIYIPVDSTLASYHNKWGMQNTIWASTSVDARDLNYDPSSGWFASQRLAWTGLLPSLESEFFFRSDTKGEIYFTLLDIPVSETWNLKFVLAGLTTLSFVQPASDSPISASNKLYIDGMFNGRGWNSLYSTFRKNAMWSTNVELRMPIAPGIFAVDFFFDAVALKENVGEMFTSLSFDDFYFSFGPGIRFSLQQFPLRLLWANTFQVKDGSVQWENGKGPNWKFVLSFSITKR
ncbi:MAG: outer membrane protein assembly factor BamA [Spirochaetaceae bacterium]|nr:outer membrane protein assembly factor BamA [Spirochaetaceae bacterium]